MISDDSLDLCSVKTFAEMSGISIEEAIDWVDNGTVPSMRLADFRMVNLARLRADQAVLPALFEDLEAALPTGLQLTELKLADGRLQVTGLAVSGAVVAQFMRDLERSAVLQGLELKHVKSMPTGDQFVLTAHVSAFWS